MLTSPRILDGENSIETTDLLTFVFINARIGKTIIFVAFELVYDVVHKAAIHGWFAYMLTASMK